MWGRLGLATLLFCGCVWAQDPSEINARFEQLKAVEKFGANYIVNQRTNLLFPVPYRPENMSKIPKKAREEFDKGNEALVKNNFDGAKKHYESAIQGYADFVMAHVNLAVALSNLKDIDGAERELQAAIKLDPRCAPAFQNLGVVGIQSGRMADAETQLRMASKLDPVDLKTLTLLAYAQAMNREFDAAVATASRVHAAKDHGGYAYSHMIAATALDASGHPQQAIAEYKLFIKEDPSDPRVPAAKKALGELEAQSGQPAKP